MTGRDGEDGDWDGCEGVGPLKMTAWEMALWAEHLKALAAKPGFGYATHEELAKIPLHGSSWWWRNYVGTAGEG